MQPGSQPFAVLAAALGQVPGVDERLIAQRLAFEGAGDALADLPIFEGDSSRLLLVVDQFEELFTMVDQVEASRFLALLAATAADPSGRVHVLVTLRADFYDRPLVDPHMGQLFADNVVSVAALGPGPARSGGDPSGSTARHHRRAAPRRPPHRRRGRPTQRVAALPVRAHRAVRCPRRCGARCRHVRADWRRPQSHRPSGRIAVQPAATGRAGDREAAVPADRHGLRRHRRPTPRAGVRARVARCRRDRPAAPRSTRSLATGCWRSIATPRRAARRSRSPTRHCSPSGTGYATGSTNIDDDLTKQASFLVAVNEWEASGQRPRLPPDRQPSQRLRDVGGRNPAPAHSDGARLHRGRGSRARCGSGSCTTNERTCKSSCVADHGGKGCCCSVWSRSPPA